MFSLKFERKNIFAVVRESDPRFLHLIYHNLKVRGKQINVTPIQNSKGIRIYKYMLKKFFALVKI